MNAQGINIGDSGRKRGSWRLEELEISSCKLQNLKADRRPWSGVGSSILRFCNLQLEISNASHLLLPFLTQGRVPLNFKFFRRLPVVFGLLVFVLVQSASAHPVPFSFLDFYLTSSGMEATLILHDFDVAHDLGVSPPERLREAAFLAERAPSIRALLADRLRITADGKPVKPEWSVPEALADRQAVRVVLRFPGVSAPGKLGIAANMFPYDPVHQTFVNIYENGDLTRQSILNHFQRELEYVTGTRQGALGVIARFVPEGIHHILIGPDHLLFLVGLLLLGGSLRRLLLVVTAFTIAHSITLSLAALEIFTPPARIIEPAIALSIVYVGFDNLLVKEGRDVRAWIAFSFGFIHGFGFANVLKEMDLPRRALGWSLFSFNLGVEIGQMVVVLVVATALATLRARSEQAGRMVAIAGSILVILAGAFWFVQRVFFPGA
jgi:hydrogenase/urease accessory protein HupE